MEPLAQPYARIVDEGVAALGVPLPAAARAAIDGHAALLAAWTRAINLTAIRDPEGIARLHVLDSLTAVEVLRSRGVRSFLDLGSGGGYPGLPLAAALPAERALLVDSVGKKARFLETAAAATGLAGRVSVSATRAEALARDPAHRGRWPAVTARAVATLADLQELAMPLLAPGGLLVAWKRGPLDAELAAARAAPPDLGAGEPEVLDVALAELPDHRLVLVPRVGPTAATYPREPAERRRAGRGT